MAKKSKQVDEYIENSAAFAKPILKRLRKAFHQACPEVEEVIKWRVPHFQYQGLLGGIAAFKSHVTLGFWKSKLMSDPAGLFGKDPKGSMCNARFESLDDLPDADVLASYVMEACVLNAQGVKPPARKRGSVEVPALPTAFKSALSKHKQAQASFDAMSASHRREYVDWIAEAKRDTTRDKRIQQALEWLAEGKSRNWKYEKKS